MGDLHEQHVSVKFCFRLWKTFSEAFEILNQAFGSESVSRTQTMSGTNVLKRAELQLWTKNVQDDLQQHKKNPKSLEIDLFQSSSDLS
jgi:hypothetical protein